MGHSFTDRAQNNIEDDFLFRSFITFRLIL